MSNTEPASSHDANLQHTTSRMAQLNDELRRQGRGGRTVITAGLAALPPEELHAVVAAVAGFDAFTPENDPYGEHDCALLRVGEQAILWKIDYFDLELRFGSSDPSDSSVTARVLTIMLAGEY